MSSHLYVFDGPFYHYSRPETVSPDGDFFLPGSFSPFTDSSIDILQESSNSPENQDPVHNSSSVDTFRSSILSSSPPTHQPENLNLYQTTILQPPANGSDVANTLSLTNGYDNFSVLDALKVKAEENQSVADPSWSYQSFLPHSYNGIENVAKIIQRSNSSNSFDSKHGFLLQPIFDTVLESTNYQEKAFINPENSFLVGHSRRVCSTGDLKNIGTACTTQRPVSSTSAAESSMIEESNFKVGRYSAEERKERISKYRAKRNQRNFTKTIKYTCRKRLADTRPRVRGRFARNDETGEIPNAALSAIDEDEDELWFDGLHEEEDHVTIIRGGGGGGGGGGVFCGVGQAQLQAP